MTSKGKVLLLYIVFLVFILIFARGFFPFKTLLKGHAKRFQSDILKLKDNKFDRLIIMVVDALREDFVFGEDSPMEFTKRQGFIFVHFNVLVL